MARKKQKELKDLAMDKWDEVVTKVWPKTRKELEKAMKQTKKMIVLTRWIVGLTIAMLVGIGFQIYLIILHS